MYLSFSRLIDLSHTLIPGGESRTLEAYLVHAEEVEQSVTRLPHQWYIMHNVRREPDQPAGIDKRARWYQCLASCHKGSGRLPGASSGL